MKLKPNKRDTNKEWIEKIKERLNDRDKIDDEELRFILNKIINICQK